MIKRSLGQKLWKIADVHKLLHDRGFDFMIMNWSVEKLGSYEKQVCRIN